MTAKEYLSRKYNLDKLIESMEYQLLELETMIHGGAINYGDKIQTSGRSSTEGLMCKAVDLKSQINDRIKEKLLVIEEIMITISRVGDNTLEYILLERYVHYKEWEKIAIELGYNIRHIYKLHRESLEKIQKIIDENIV
ncbi:hypothetical protein [Peptostreptococcus anaerobius]|uniref:Phage transcriptional regulator, RinA family n=1 Tax=Peptostreptococcus anaerobius 653-L TaxID=596329 RepID=D3MU57_9FIRM|nr:hypothetical protein [Peptostreptococcus anaerobius]EFD04360.1 hypothetical protein HMPREF0631_1363 [Peptostreptococcus anaerobius 653-L]